MDIESQYNKALDYLYSFVDYSLKHSSELAKAEFNLDRMFALMEELGNPQNKYPIIHVAGLPHAVASARLLHFTALPVALRAPRRSPRPPGVVATNWLADCRGDDRALDRPRRAVRGWHTLYCASASTAPARVGATAHLVRFASSSGA